MNYLEEKINKLLNKFINSKPTVRQGSPALPIHSRLDENIHHIENTFGNSSDLVIRHVTIGQKNTGLFYIDGLTNTEIVSHFVIEPMMNVDLSQMETGHSSAKDLFQFLKESVLTSSELKEITYLNELFSSLLAGDTVMLIDGYKKGYSINTAGGNQRGIEEPTTQTVVRGPKEGFTENLRTNTTLIRRKIRDPNLWLETKQVGSITKTNIGLMYIKGIANENVIGEVHSRIEQINIDGVLESGYIEELIQDKTLTPFPTVYNTERPDVIAAGLLEGRVAILVDGTPFVLLVPGLFIQFYQSPEDYYQRSDLGLIRLLRYIALVLALLGPSLYIAVTTFHQEMLPSQLVINIAAQREGVPFPAFVEAIIMEITFEILREAGLRMPRAVGQAVSIVGALVIGQAAVEAGIVSAVMVIVVAITAISNFTFPAFNMAIAIRILRFGFMFLAASFGLFGISVGIIAVLLHLCSLRSFGFPYMTPMAPFYLWKQKDTLIRFPISGLFSRKK